jgi:hypothetical protein
MTIENSPKIGTGEAGRPTNEEHVLIDKTLRDYFSQGFSAAYTIQSTGLNKNTVYDKFRELEAEIKEAQIADIAERSEARKLQRSLVDDDLLSRVTKMFRGLEMYITKCLSEGTAVPAPMFNKYTDLLDEIQRMQHAKRVHVPEKFEFNGQVYER